MREDEAVATASTPSRASPSSGGAGEQAPISFSPVKMPWHVRHARALLVAAGLAAAAVVAALAHYVWSLRTDALEHSIGLRWRDGGTPTAPPPAVPLPAVSPPAVPKQGIAGAAALPAQAPQIRPQSPRQAVTHTRREESAPPAEPARQAAAPPAQKTACPQAVAALGLCESVASKGER
jgi:hypothetical protein